MRNLLKLKKSKIAIYLFLIFNQIVFSANAFNFGKLDLKDSLSAVIMIALILIK